VLFFVGGVSTLSSEVQADAKAKSGTGPVLSVIQFRST
jgi:hypothetical protein